MADTCIQGSSVFRYAHAFRSGYCAVFPDPIEMEDTGNALHRVLTGDAR